MGCQINERKEPKRGLRVGAQRVQESSASRRYLPECQRQCCRLTLQSSLHQP